MSGSVIPFPSPAAAQIADALEEIRAASRRETARLDAECRAAQEESERIRLGYAQRQQQIERLLAGISSDVERA